jgi:hypothetical protein
VSNPLYFLPPAALPADVDSRTYEPADLSWKVEKPLGSDGDLAGSEQDVSLDFRLRQGERASQFVALAGDFRGPRRTATAIAFDGVASRPMRVSVQLRYPSGGGERWARSVYLDTSQRHVVVPLDHMLPVDHQTGSAPSIATAKTLLFVVDLVNASPGSSGTFRVANVTLGR